MSQATVYINYAPVKVVYGRDNGLISGEKVIVDTDDLPDRKYRNNWKWDAENKKVIIDFDKIKAVEKTKEGRNGRLLAIKEKFGISDEELEDLKAYVKSL